MSVGKKIGELIKEQGKTQKEVAERAGITPQALNKYIKRDSARIDVQAFYRICDVLGVDISYFDEERLKDFYKEHPDASPINDGKPNSLSNNEKELVDMYRELTDEQRHTINITIKAMLADNDKQALEKKKKA